MTTVGRSVGETAIVTGGARHRRATSDEASYPAGAEFVIDAGLVAGVPMN